MAEPSFQKKTTLDKDLKQVARLEKASRMAGREVGRLGLGLIFLLGVLLVVQLNVGLSHGSLFIVVAAVIGGYMALNIGANDVANNVGPAVGSRALTMVGALMIAAVFETAGAIIAGGDGGFRPRGKDQRELTLPELFAGGIGVPRALQAMAEVMHQDPFRAAALKAREKAHSRKAKSGVAQKKKPKAARP